MKILLIRKKNKPTVKGTFSDKILSPIICSLVNFYIINKKKKRNTNLVVLSCIKGAKSRSVLFLLGCFYIQQAYKVFLNGSRTTSRQLNNRQKNYHSGQYSDRGMSHKHSGLKFGRGRGTSRVFGYPHNS